VQPFLSGAISKTVNMPEHSTVEEIMETYLERLAARAQGGGDLPRRLQAQPAGEHRQGARTASAQSPTPPRRPSRAATAPRPAPLRRRMPATRRSLTHKFDIAGHEGYITVGLYDDGSPGEMFITMAKEGSTVGG
jgi:ribonucleoside-diphosphate reductase alpha chain